MIQRLLTFVCVLGGLLACDNSEVSDNPIPPGGGIPNLYDWSIQGEPSPTNFTDIYFVNERVGWVVGENNTILSTVTGGIEWPQAPVNSTEGTFRSVHMIDEQRGWIAGDMKGTKPDGSVYVSISGGAYPETQQQTDLPMNTVFMLDDKLGWSGGENGQLLYTQDGKEWNESTTKPDVSIFDIHFTDEQNGWLAAANGNIYRSRDGGITWAVEHNMPSVDLYSIHMIDSLLGWACGNGSAILQGSYSGNAMVWTEKSVGAEFGNFTWNDIHFVDKDNGWIVGEEGTVYHTDNGGNDWTRETTNVLSELFAVHMVSKNKGWIAGESGAILTYTP